MELQNKIYELRDVHRIVEFLSEQFQKAIIIEDANFELVAYSSPNEFSFDPIQQKTILTKRCPLFIIERLKKDGIIDALYESDQAMRIDAMEDVQFYERIVISLKHAETVYGYLWIYEAKESSSDEVLRALEEVAPYIGDILHEQNVTSVSSNLSEASQFLWKLLNDEFLNGATMQREASLAQVVLPEQFSVLVVSIKDPNYVTVLSKIKQFLLKEHIMFYLGKGSEIVGLIDLGKHRHIETVLSKLQEILTDDELANVYLGIGNEYADIKYVRHSYLEALEVIETKFFLNVQKQSRYYFSELGLMRHFKQIFKKNMHDDYRNRKIITLMEHELTNRSELLKTLWEFLKTDCKVGETAKRLYIHPNTFNYRMKQIVQLTNIDFANFHEKAELYEELYLIYHVSDYMEHYKSVLQ